ncbi:MAG: urease accessory protein [Gammaproteobacteria bacterium]|jgi:urease accessory protein
MPVATAAAPDEPVPDMGAQQHNSGSLKESHKGNRGRIGWRAELELGFVAREQRTVLAHRRHCGPLMVQSAFYPEGQPCHVYVLHPPGGLVGGDHAHIDVDVGEHAHALLTTPAAGKFYRSLSPGSDGPVGAITQRINVHAGGVAEWLPCESIVFDGANCDARTHIQLHESARILAWDGWVFGRPACGERFESGAFAQQVEVRIGERPVLIERNQVAAGSPWMTQPWGLGGRVALATLIAYPGGELALECARAACLDEPGQIAACTELDGVLVCRVTTSSLPLLRRQMEHWWRALRVAVVGYEPVSPRIWAT